MRGVFAVRASKLVIVAEELEAKLAAQRKAGSRDDDTDSKTDGDFERVTAEPFVVEKKPPHRLHEDPGMTYGI